MICLVARWLVASLVLLISACSGRGGGSTSTSNPSPPGQSATITGIASKGLVLGATVTAYAVTSSGIQGAALGSTPTNATTGAYSLTLNNYSGPVLLVPSGGSYTDEATGHTVQVPTARLQAVIASVTAGSNVTAQITPLTTMAEAQAAATTGGLTETNINAANSAVSSYFGGGTSIDILNTQPINPLEANSANGASQSAINYGLILAGLSQEAQTVNLTNPFDLVTALVRDFSNGKYNGYDTSTALTLEGRPMDPNTGTTDLADAIGAFSANSQNVSGGTVSSSIAAALGNPPNNYSVGGTLSGLSGTVVLNNTLDGDSLTLTSNGPFTFPTKIVVGGAYNVTCPDG